ncbi:MAG: DUF2273 domain-containing protein [Dehalococcoidia bacterium]|nr:DUF2273 domain-containing protein [Dehalococcoidia bacterium]
MDDNNNRWLNPKTIGAIIGLVLGLVVLIFGVGKAVILVLFVLAGWYVGKVWSGEIDLAELYERFKSDRNIGRRK